MPLYKTITKGTSIIVHIWKIEELETELSKDIRLTQNCQDRLDGMKSQLHRKGFLSIRHLMALEGYEDSDMYYDTAGKPHLRDGKHISITHSNHFTGIILADGTEVGIDIEKQRDKILRIAHKFTPIEEYRTIANTDALIRKLTIVWGCKESLYKIYAQEGLSFINHIDISDFYLENGKTTGKIEFQGNISRYELEYLEFEGFTCVYAFGPIPN
ncbi:MAG: 4'-phosphopantetheinyl transferase superfamily protein [Maribacter sp.]|nr:4'-phosphopantetheinyl transferase superfamily protein [Maribacter sp.]